MIINEIINESQQLEEGWKQQLAAAALAAGAALGGGYSGDAQASNHGPGVAQGVSQEQMKWNDFNFKGDAQLAYALGSLMMMVNSLSPQDAKTVSKIYEYWKSVGADRGKTNDQSFYKGAATTKKLERNGKEYLSGIKNSYMPIVKNWENHVDMKLNPNTAKGISPPPAAKSAPAPAPTAKSSTNTSPSTKNSTTQNIKTVDISNSKIYKSWTGPVDANNAPAGVGKMTFLDGRVVQANWVRIQTEPGKYKITPKLGPATIWKDGKASVGEMYKKPDGNVAFRKTQ